MILFKVFWSEADHAFIATCPKLPGVSAFGLSEAIALREAKAALKLVVEDYLESGTPLLGPVGDHE